MLEASQCVHLLRTFPAKEQDTGGQVWDWRNVRLLTSCMISAGAVGAVRVCGGCQRAAAAAHDAEG